MCRSLDEYNGIKSHPLSQSMFQKDTQIILPKCFNGGLRGDLHLAAVPDGQTFNGGSQSCLQLLP